MVSILFFNLIVLFASMHLVQFSFKQSMSLKSKLSVWSPNQASVAALSSSLSLNLVPLKWDFKFGNDNHLGSGLDCIAGKLP